MDRFLPKRRFWINKDYENQKINGQNFSRIFLTKAQKE